jgi:hypothetical protein
MNNNKSLPSHLITLLEDMQFVAKIGEDSKLCVKCRDYADKSWQGYFKRRLYSEKPEHTTTFIRDTCNLIKDHIIDNGINNCDIDILEGTISFREGILRIIKTYSQDTKTVTSLNVSIKLLDKCLPMDIKIKMGLINTNKIKSDDMLIVKKEDFNEITDIIENDEIN